VNTTFEQPKHLTAVSYHRLARAIRPLLIAYGILMSCTVLFTLYLRTAAGQAVTPLEWILAATVGLLAAGLHRLALRFQSSRRRYVEFRDGGIFLAQRGIVALRRFVSWSLDPDPLEPRYNRLLLTYKSGLGRQRWSMLLDDAEHIAELRHALSTYILQQDPGHPGLW
jgi:hypothetical protein